jgi:hypothetical protein
MLDGKFILVSDNVGKDMPNKNPITIPAKIDITSIIPSFGFLLFEQRIELSALFAMF